MAVTRVVELRIDAFRRFGKTSIAFGDEITLIAGQNGTSKSTLLGMLAQPFSFGVVRGKTAGKADSSRYTANYHGLKLHEHVDMTGKPFMYDCDDVFRLSREFDFGKQYTYETVLEVHADATLDLPNNALLTKSRHRRTAKSISGMRFVTGPGASHESGEGNFPHPVIYLGLSRLWPLADTSCRFPSDPLPKADREWYVKQYNELLCLDEHGNSAKFMDTAIKRRFITPESSNYDGESCSAGQDNLSQLLTAILSFRSLKKRLGKQYRGGLLLIDELDATLHALAQDRLLALLCNVSKELGLQVVATTHSLRLLEKAYQSALQKHIKVLNLANKDGAVVIEDFQTFQEISDHLKVVSTLPSQKKAKRVSVLFEDAEGRFLFQQICGTKLRDFISAINPNSLGAGYLKNFADISIMLPELNDVIFVPDGDMSKTWPDPPKNTVFLPGEERPETLVFKHLFDLKEADPFWKKAGTTYTRQVAIVAPGGGSTIKKGNEKRWVKKWYREQSPHWGRGNNKVFKSWIASHKPECLEFCTRFIELINRCHKGAGVPKQLEQKVLAQFK